MKIDYSNLLRFATLLCTAALLASATVRADDSELDEKTRVGEAKVLIQRQSSEPAPQQNSPYSDSPFGRDRPVFYYSGPKPAKNVSSAIRKAAEGVRDAKGDEAKSDAQKQLTDLLSKCYDDDMVQREKELKQIEERLTKLRDLLERRRTKKQEIIDLQTKVALNEVEGLGFYDSERSAKANTLEFTARPVEVAAERLSIAPLLNQVPAPTPPTPPRAPKPASR